MRLNQPSRDWPHFGAAKKIYHAILLPTNLIEIKSDNAAA
jgi:hypothetical protein